MRFAILALILLSGCKHASPLATAPETPATTYARRFVDSEPIITPAPVAIDQWDSFEPNAFGAPAFDLVRVDAWLEGHTIVVIGVMGELPGTFGVDWSASCGLEDLRPNRPNHFPALETDSSLYISGEAYNPNYSNLSYQDADDLGHLLKEGPGSVSISGNTVRFTCPDSMLAFAPNAIVFQGIHYVNGVRRGSDRWRAVIRRWGSNGGV